MKRTTARTDDAKAWAVDEPAGGFVANSAG